MEMLSNMCEYHNEQKHGTDQLDEFWSAPMPQKR